MPATKRKPASPAKAKAATNESRLAKLGLRSDMDLVLHLRYEDETQIQPIAEAGFMAGNAAQVEGVVTECDIQYRPRRQLVVTIADDSGPLVMRFLNFYGSQVKQLATGTRVRARGEVRHGFFGAEMVHPVYKVVQQGDPLPGVSAQGDHECADARRLARYLAAGTAGNAEARAVRSIGPAAAQSATGRG